VNTLSRDERSVSDVVGYVLIFSLVTSTVAIVTVTGLGSLRDVRDAEQISNAERAFDVLADNLADVHQEGAPSRSTELSLEEARADTTTTITVNVSWQDTPRPRTHSTYTVNPIVWEASRESETQIVYELGAVLRDEPGEGGLVIREPPFVLERDRLILPIVRTWTDQGQSFGGNVIRVRGRSTQSSVVNTSTEGDYDVLWLNITSPRADVWQEYLEPKSVTDQCLLEDTPDGDKVACEFVTPEEVYITGQQIRITLDP